MNPCESGTAGYWTWEHKYYQSGPGLGEIIVEAIRLYVECPESTNGGHVATSGLPPWGSSDGACHTMDDPERCQLRAPTAGEKGIIAKTIANIPAFAPCGAVRKQLQGLYQQGRIMMYDGYFRLGPGAYLSGDHVADQAIHIYSGRATGWGGDPTDLIHEAAHTIGFRHTPGSDEIGKIVQCYP